MYNNTTRNTITLFITAILIIVAIVWLEGKKVHNTTQNVSTTNLALMGTTTVADDSDSASTTITTNPTLPIPSSATIAQIRAQKAKQYQSAVEFVDPTGFVNTPGSTLTQSGAPINLKQYIGKDVILLDFMTYSCINCQRTFPYLTAWYGKYKDQGLIVIGIHTPEFDFEKVYGNVAQAMQRFGITYPVVMDSNYGTWTAYGNQYWPHEYVIDIDGYIAEDHIGEGGYADTETKIQQLLKERDQRLGLTDTVPTGIVNPAGAGQQIEAQSPETYFGSNRNQYLGNGTSGQTGVQNFSLPSNLSLNTFYFSGSWDVQGEYAQGQSTSSGFSYVYSAKNVYFVASASDPKSPVIAEVTLDGQPVPASLRGSDVYENNGKTYIKVGQSRLYNIISGSDLNNHTLNITAQSAGLQAFTLTFG